MNALLVFLAFKAILPFLRANGGMAMRRKRTKDSVWYEYTYYSRISRVT